MSWFKQLRWRLIFTQLAALGVGIAIVLFATRYFILGSAPEYIRPHLVKLTSAPETLAQVENDLLITVRNSVLLSVLIASIIAIGTSVISSYVLWNDIVFPLQQISASSRRIADGRFDERVGVPNSPEIAGVANNFNQMAAALERVEAQRVTMIGNVSHELRTPLTGLRGYVEGLQDGMFPTNNETYAQMSSEIARLTRLIDDLQDLSRAEAGAIELKPHVFDVQPIISQITNQLQPQALAKSLTLTVDAAQSPIFVLADSDRTAQVLTNLIGNALRYTPEGGMVHVSAENHPSLTKITVTDSGIGIPANDLPYIFERFYRVDRSRSRQSGGSGVGLTISRHLARAMGGDVSAESPGPDLGATFTFSLPSNQQ